MAKKEVKVKNQAPDFAFGRENYIIMLIGLAFIFTGFICMSGGASEDPAAFDPGMFNFRRLTLAPILVIAGFVIEVFAIVKKSKE